MTRPEFALNYRRCTPKQLNAFYRERSGEEAPRGPRGGLIKRERYVYRLRKLDSKATFPFMDLPAEMRYLVYDELLTHDKSAGRKAYPAILRANKQGYEEACGLLLQNSVVALSTTIWSAQPVQGSLRYEESVYFRYESGGNEHSRLVRHLNRLDGLKHAENLSLTLSLDLRDPHQRTVARETFEDFLVALERYCRNAKQVRVNFLERSASGAERSVSSLLWPIKQFSGVKLDGLSKEEETEFWK